MPLQVQKKSIICFASIACYVLLLMMPGVFAISTRAHTPSLLYKATMLATSFSFLLMPVVFFYRNIKLYLYLLLLLIIPSTLFIFALHYFDIYPGFELIALSMQTNLTEVKEIAAGYIKWFIPVTIVYILIYLFAVKMLPFKRIPFNLALGISVLACMVAALQLRHEKSRHKLTTYDLFGRYYPASLASGIMQAYDILKQNRLIAKDSFAFKAYKEDSLPGRRIYLFIIGESSRYDRWQVNGYPVTTSPKLASRNDLISFPDVVAGAYLTWLSVPQMITRATPDNMALQFKEKSILTAFKEAGFKTAWLSNQSDKEIFWSGSINLHARTADISVFSPTKTPNFESEDYYDERLLPILDSIIKLDNRDLFVVLHTMGCHWDYSKRYPNDFDYYQPSGYTTTISPPEMNKRQAISNSYDNSILYADYVIDNAIRLIDSQDALSYVMYLSDHGEDLFDATSDRINFHLSASPATLHVPLFLWTSRRYKEVYPGKQAAIVQNKNKKIGSENTFFSLLDLAGVDFKENDLTKSIASPSFTGSLQKYFNNNDLKGHFYKDFDTVIHASKR